MQANLHTISVPQSSLSQAVAANRPAAPTVPAVENVLLPPQTSNDAAPQVLQSETQPQALSSDELAMMQLKRDAKLEYDNNTRTQQGAIASYLNTQHAAKRDEIQQMVGIDLYA
ncbi:hypothetical protein [Shewanella sp. SR44-3]|uniref:hypothetical protein n=1 Tax=unclassified Shewanella TaxID=196818 RepID=UPI0015FC60FE|nr:hypothetical protein [Shewanella sp. SR44-3]MBB1270418.1 hypothetical protein [Shewanella sp. SR44-3]